MSATRYFKCNCQQCGGRIEYPVESVGTAVECPHCGQQTDLTLPAPLETGSEPRKRIGWAITGAIILLVGIIAIVVAIGWVNRLTPAGQAKVPAKGSLPPPAVPTERIKVMSGFKVGQMNIETAGNFRYATGLIRNETDRSRFGVRVELDLLDEFGEKMGSTSDYAAIIEPRGEWRFRAMVLETNAASAAIRAIKEQE